MRLPRKAGALALGAITAGICCLLAWGLLQDPAEPWQRVSDGSRVRILGVTYGTAHRVVEGQVWQRLLLPLFPQRGPFVSPSLAGAFPIPSSGMVIPVKNQSGVLGGLAQEYETPQPSLVVWLRYRAPDGWGGMRTFRGEDEHGCRLLCDNRAYPDVRTGEMLSALVFTNLPRRSATLTLRPVDPLLGGVENSSLTVRLPHIGPQPVWQPRPLPQPAQSGPLTISLIGWTPMRPVPTAEFEVRSGGKPTLDWEPVTLTVSDATGNVHTSLREQQYEPDPRRFGFFPLCNREAAWKLETEFAPTLPPRPAPGRPDPNWSPAPKAPPAWRWAVKIPAPPPGKPGFGGPKLERGALQLEILGASGAGTVPASVWGIRRLRCPAVRVQLRHVEQPLRLTLVRVTDERGRSAVPRWQENPLDKQWDLTLPRPSHFLRAGTQERSFVLPELPGAKTLQLEFVVHQVIRAEFLAAPPRP